VLKQLMDDRVVGGCPKLSAMAMQTLEKIEVALTDPGAVASVRQLRVLKMRYGKAVGTAAAPGGAAAAPDVAAAAAAAAGGGLAPLAARARVTLELAEDGLCKLSINTK